MENLGTKAKVKRNPKRGMYDKETIYNILDEAFICHIAFVFENYPVNIPTLYGRKDDCLYIHGAGASRMLLELDKGIECSVCFTILDGLVLARSAYHHSMNYRSVIVFGKAEKVTDKIEKNDALKVISDNILKSRWEEIREPNDGELAGTMVLKIKIEEASAKIRLGGPVDEKVDYDLDIWAGVVPVSLKYDSPIADEKNKTGLELPASVKNIINYRKS